MLVFAGPATPSKPARMEPLLMGNRFSALMATCLKEFVDLVKQQIVTDTIQKCYAAQLQPLATVAGKAVQMGL